MQGQYSVGQSILTHTRHKVHQSGLTSLRSTAPSGPIQSNHPNVSQVMISLPIATACSPSIWPGSKLIVTGPVLVAPTQATGYCTTVFDLEILFLWLDRFLTLQLASHSFSIYFRLALTGKDFLSSKHTDQSQKSSPLQSPDSPFPFAPLWKGNRKGKSPSPW